MNPTLFDAPWPERLPAGTEQRVLPVSGTIAARYAEWRRTPDGAKAFAWMEEMARRVVRKGAHRLSAKALVELARAELRVVVNNTFTPEIARELEDTHAELRGLFELRRRGAA